MHFPLKDFKAETSIIGRIEKSLLYYFECYHDINAKDLGSKNVGKVKIQVRY